LGDRYKFLTDRKPMLTLLPTLVALVGAAAFASIAFRARKHRRRFGVTVPLEASGYPRAVAWSVRAKMVAAAGAGALVAAVVALTPVPLLHLGLGAAIAPGVGGIVACLVISAAPLPRAPHPSGVRQADLVPRLASSFGPRWGFVLPLVSAAVLIIFLIATAALSSTDDQGLSRQIGQRTPAGYETAGPYPGWFYVVPVLVVTVLLSLSALAALRRIAVARSLGIPALGEFDRAIRGALTRFVMLLSSSVIVFYIGAVALMAGSSARTVSQWSKPTALFDKRAGVAAAATDPTFQVSAGDFIHGVVQPQYTAAAIETTLGILLIGFGLTLVFLAVGLGGIRLNTATPAPADEREGLPA
jgi:hypothetical protein